MDEFGIYDCATCPNSRKLQWNCNFPLTEINGWAPEDTRDTERPSRCLRSQLDSTMGLLSKAASIWSNGQIGASEIDFWYYEAITYLLTEQNRLQMARLKAKRAK